MEPGGSLLEVLRDAMAVGVADTEVVLRVGEAEARGARVPAVVLSAIPQ